jgi:hypothetical protein
MTNAYGWTNTYAIVDEFGNMVARFKHDSGGKRINNPLLGYSGYVIDYDESGRHRTSLTYQNADGSPASVSVKGVQARSWKFSQDSADHRNVRSVK